MLSILHHGANEPTDISIERADVAVPASSWAMIPGTDTAVIQVLQFSSGSGDAATKDLQTALDAGAKQIVLDLRGNPGGYVNEAVKLASQFLDKGTVYEEQDRDGNVTPIDAQGGGIATQIPLVVLVDHGSASSAEIVAGALQGNDRAKLVGETTFGTGTVLNTYTLSDGSAIRLGVLEWLTPTGQTIFGKGITPDYVVSLPSDGTADGSVADRGGHGTECHRLIRATRSSPRRCRCWRAIRRRQPRLRLRLSPRRARDRSHRHPPRQAPATPVSVERRQLTAGDLHARAARPPVGSYAQAAASKLTSTVRSSAPRTIVSASEWLCSADASASKRSSLPRDRLAGRLDDQVADGDAGALGRAVGLDVANEQAVALRQADRPAHAACRPRWCDADPESRASRRLAVCQRIDARRAAPTSVGSAR